MTDPNPIPVSSAAIGGASAFIGVSKAFRFRQPLTN
jgi:hypothetical protein